MTPAATPAPHVTILLSARNGAAYLPEQLDSLLAQRDAAWTLLWRDDGSTDATPTLLRDFAARAPATELPTNMPSLGPAASFWTLLQSAPSGAVAFCDQDDVWHPDKLARGLSALTSVAPDVPTLYCARQTLVDTQLRPLGASPPIPRHIVFPMPLAQNVATGCTILLNDAAVRLLRHTMPPHGTLHDWWCLLLVAAAGGTVIVDPTEVMLYRQHPTNAVGAPANARARARAALQRGRRPFMAALYRQVDALRALAPLLDRRSVHQLDAIADALGRGAAARIKVLWRTRLRRQGWLESLVFTVWFVGDKARPGALPLDPAGVRRPQTP